LLGEADRAIEALSGAGISVLVLKGAALLGSVYDLGERAMEDVDLLVSPRHAAAAERALRRAGFSRGGDPRRPLGSRHHHACAFARDPNLRIDLHTAIAYPPRWRLTAEALFSRAVAWPLATAARNSVVRRPATEDLLIHPAVHAVSSELQTDDRAILDLQQIAECLLPDWAEVVARADHVRASVALWLLLAHASHQTGRPVSEWAEARLQPSRPRRSYLGWLLWSGAGKGAPSFAHRRRRMRQVLMGPAATDDAWRFAAAAVRFGLLRAADAAIARIAPP
jgi:hypothetical protein